MLSFLVLDVDVEVGGNTLALISQGGGRMSAS